MSDQSHDGRRRVERFGAAALGVMFFCLYVATASHTVILNYDDSAEFQTIAVVGGLPHQPYPLWCILARFFALLPIGEPAFRTTLFSITAASLTLAFVFVLLIRRTHSVVIAGGVTATLGISLSFWQNAVFADIYALNTLVFVLTAWAAGRFYRNPSPRRWLVFALGFGFLMVNHTTNAATVPAVLLMLVWSGTRWFRGATVRLLLASAFLVAFPFTLYLYTYEIDRQHTPMNWIDNYGRYVHMDRGDDPHDLDGFVGRMRFQMFSTRSTPAYSPGEWMRMIQKWFRLTAGWEFPVVGALLAFLGLLAVWVSERRLAALTTVLMIPYVLLSVYVFDGGGIQKYSNTAYVLFAFLIARGLEAVRAAARRLRLPATPVMVALVALLLAAPLVRYSTMPRTADYPSTGLPILSGCNERGKVYGVTMSELLPPHSLVFGRWSHANTLFYHKYVAGRLGDVDVRYLLPRSEYMLDVVAREQPAALFFTYRPDTLAFHVDDVTPVIPGLSLYRVTPASR